MANLLLAAGFAGKPGKFPSECGLSVPAARDGQSAPARENDPSTATASPVTALEEQRNEESLIIMWYFRVIELSGGCWVCRHGRRILGMHCDYDEAIEHLTAVAREHRPAELILHRLDGTVQSLGSV